MILPSAATKFYIQHRDITLNTELGKIRTKLGKISINPNFEPFGAQNYLFLTIFGQNQANLRMTRKKNFNYNYTNHI